MLIAESSGTQKTPEVAEPAKRTLITVNVLITLIMIHDLNLSYFFPDPAAWWKQNTFPKDHLNHVCKGMIGFL